MSKIIICCRASDSLGITGRILDCLVSHFGRDVVVLADLDASDDQKKLSDVRSSIPGAALVLATIGQNWLSGIENESDPVRSIIATTLKSRVPIIPVLVNGARMPTSDQVPPELKDLVFRNATKIDPGPDFDRHVERLIRSVEVVGRSKISVKPEKVGLGEPIAAQSEPALPQLSPVFKATVARIFISHSSRDRKIVETLCRALESRGLQCWISSRDVAGGDDYQSAIVGAIRNAKIMLIVFTENANNSDEIKRELVLASQNKLVVIPVRIEDVLPNDALAYQFAIRQWIDFLGDWENAIDTLCARVAEILKG